jgi:hypothetical protein
LHNLVRKGVLPHGQVRQVRHALNIYNQRELANREIESRVDSNHPRKREIEKVVALIGILEGGGLMSPQRAAEYRNAYVKSTRRTVKELRADRRAFWEATVGPVVSWYHDKAGANS